MKRSSLAVFVPFVVMLALVAPTAALVSAPSVTITYLANEGFLIVSGEKKILVDAIFAEGIDPYRKLGGDRQAALLAGRPPFDGVDLVLATHVHADHFAPEPAIKFLRARAETILITTPQARASIARQLGSPDDPLLKRVRSSLPGEGKRETFTHAGISITTLNLHHGRSQNPTENLGFLITLGSVKLLHVGDTMANREEFAINDLVKASIDVALLPYWMLTGDEWKDAVTDAIAARSILAMHIPAKHAPSNYFTPARNYADLKRIIKKRHPDSRILEPGESLTVEAEGS